MRGPCIISASSIDEEVLVSLSRRWPREVILRDEQVWSNGNFWPLKNIPMPKPLSYVVRAFGEDCMAAITVWKSTSE